MIYQYRSLQPFGFKHGSTTKNQHTFGEINIMKEREDQSQKEKKIIYGRKVCIREIKDKHI